MQRRENGAVNDFAALTLQSLLPAEGANDSGDVALLAVYLVIHAPHFIRGDFAAEIGERVAKTGKSHQRVLPTDRNRVVRRKIVAVVFENHQVAGGDDPIGRIAG